jgi:putative ABC transport system permease protein
VTALLDRLLGRLPIGWLQLKHSRARLAAAIAGVSFANILVFMQLGFLGALSETIVIPYQMMSADIMISAPDANTLADGSNVPRQRMFQVLAVPGVAAASPFYRGRMDWQLEDGDSVELDVFGVDPAARVFSLDAIEERRLDLVMPDVMLVDRGTRNVDPAVFEVIESGKPLSIESQGRSLDVIGTFEVGAGFSADGYAITSDQTFLRLFPQRIAGAPNHIFIWVEEGLDPEAMVERLEEILPASDTIVRTVHQAALADQRYQTTERPIGIVFGFGVIIGVLVGIIIVYQVLSTDVADHLSEYATLKAVGYRQVFFLGIVFEEAVILALFGFIPGVLITVGLYELVTAATGLPMAMSAERAVFVLVGTLLMCSASGALATRRLAAADPADLF